MPYIVARLLRSDLFELPELFLDSGADETEVSQVVSKLGPGEFPPVCPGVDLLLPV